MLVETVLGNVNEPAWTERLREAKVDDLVLDQWDAQKSRLRRTTSLGTELALSLARGVRLRDGDVLAWDDATATAVVARIALGEVMVVHLDTLHGESLDMVIRSAVSLSRRAEASSSQIRSPFLTTEPSGARDRMTVCPSTRLTPSRFRPRPCSAPRART